MRCTRLVGLVLLPWACGGLPMDDLLPEPGGTCVVEGETNGGSIEIQADGVDRFWVTLEARAWVRWTLSPAGARPIAVRSRHLEFSGHAEDFPVRTAGPVMALSGLVQIGSSTDIESIAVTADGLRAAFDAGSEVRLEGVPVACGLLAPGKVNQAEAAPDPAAVDERFLASGQATRAALKIHALPDDARAVSLSAPEAGLISLQLGVPAAGWRPVRWQQRPGIAVEGWARSSDVRETDSIPVSLGGWIGCRGLHVIPDHLETRTLPVDTVLFAAPGQGAWARVHTPLEVEVAREPGARYGRVWRIPEVWITGRDHAWIDLGQ